MVCYPFDLVRVRDTSAGSHFYTAINIDFFPLIKWVFMWLYLVWGKSIAFKGSNLRLAQQFPLCDYVQAACSRAEFANQREINVNDYQVTQVCGNSFFYIFDYNSTYKFYFQSKIKGANMKACLWVWNAKFGNLSVGSLCSLPDKSSLIQCKLPTWLTHEAGTERLSSPGNYMCYSVFTVF